MTLSCEHFCDKWTEFSLTYLEVTMVRVLNSDVRFERESSGAMKSEKDDKKHKLPGLMKN